MSFINKIIGGGTKAAESVSEKLAPSFRFGGFQVMGAHTRPADNRTAKQLAANIDYFAERLPEVAQFKKELKEMEPKHLGLVSDVCELGCTMEMLSTNINLRKLTLNGKNLFGTIIERISKASKENPESLNFAQEVINQTDSTASKYFLATCSELFEHPEASRHLAATKPFVKDIAKATLSGGYTMDFSKEQSFVNTINHFVNPSVNPENIETLQKVCELAEKQEKTVDAIKFIQNNVNLY